MKTSAEYLAAHVFEARRPHRHLQPVVALPDALAALEQALADAEKYRYLLMRAVRRSAAPETPRPALPASNAGNTAFDAAEVTTTVASARVLPLYPAQPAAAATGLRLAA